MRVDSGGDRGGGDPGGDSDGVDEMRRWVELALALTALGLAVWFGWVMLGG